MILHPVLPVFLVVVLVLGVAGLAVWGLVRARGRGSRMLWAGRVALVVACGLLLLRPGVPGGDVEMLASDVDVVLMVDTTASIVAEDWDGHRPRLDGVRDDVAAVVAAYPGARFALITFDATATVRVPLTADATALMTAISVLRPEPTPQSLGSSIGVGAEQLQRTLEAAAAVTPDRARMVFYFGDGEQTSSQRIESFEPAARTVSGGAVLGYGTTTGGPMRATFAGTAESGDYISYQGQRAVSTIDPDNLMRIAEQLGVEYQQRSAGVALELPPMPTTALTTAGTTEAVAELSWVVALVIAGLLAVELGAGVGRIVATARIPRRGEAS